MELNKTFLFLELDWSRTNRKSLNTQPWYSIKTINIYIQKYIVLKAIIHWRILFSFTFTGEGGGGGGQKLTIHMQKLCFLYD